MARRLRIEYPGAIYHRMNRGDHREDIFGDDEDRRRSLGTLGDVGVKTDWRVNAYCLMTRLVFWGKRVPAKSAGASGQATRA